MIYTVTLNPALDYVVSTDHFALGGLNRANRETILPGGKGINVSMVLRALGVESVALGFVAGFTGKALESALEERGIETDFLALAQGCTRINVKIKAEEESELNGKGPQVGEEGLKRLEGQLKSLKDGDILVLSGSVPAGVPAEIYGRLLSGLEGKGVETVVDTSGEALRAALPYRPFLVKPNRQELEQFLGRTLPDEAGLRRGAGELRRMGARNVLISLAGEGSLLADETGAFHRRSAPTGTVRNSVGAGDAMVAGFLAGWLWEKDYDKAHMWGVAAGSATAFSTGTAAGAEIYKLINKICP